MIPIAKSPDTIRDAVRARSCAALGSVGFVAALLIAGCDGEANPSALAAPSQNAVSPDPVPALAAVQPDPAPAGALLGPRERFYLQDCVQPECPRAVHAQAVAHCEALQLGALQDWRLPTRDEAQALARVNDLAMASGYHWTGTSFDADAQQFWIVDPSGAGQSTTIPGGRKPMIVRCVHGLKPAL